MPSIDPNNVDDLRVLEHDFWETLRATVSNVFGSHTGVAERYRREMLKAPPLQRALALHDDPLDVASTLTGAAVTEKHIALYEAMNAERSADAEPGSLVVEVPSERELTIPREVYGSMFIDETSPMVPLQILNSLMLHLGYRPLTIKSGRAFFDI